jgi:hypothetical protein
MARRIISIATMATITPVADTASMTSGQYPFFLQTASATQLIRVHEVSISGQAASSSSPTFLILSRDSTVGVTAISFAAGGMDAPMDAATAALAAAPIVGNTSTTTPQRSSAGHLMNCSLNAFGGVYFWRANKVDECPSVYGTTTPFSEVSLSAYTGGTPGAVGCHCIYEPL